MSKTMTLEDLVHIDVSADTPINFVTMGTGVTFNSISIDSLQSFDGLNSNAAFILEDSQQTMTYDELVKGLSNALGKTYKWADNDEISTTFEINTPIAFIRDENDGIGELSTWFHDGDTLKLFIAS